MINIKQNGQPLKVIDLAPEMSLAVRDALHYLGLPDRGGDFELVDVLAAIEGCGRDLDSAWKRFARLTAYCADRRARGIDVLEKLERAVTAVARNQQEIANELAELTNYMAMPMKIVRDADGRSLGAMRVSRLTPPVKIKNAK